MDEQPDENGRRYRRQLRDLEADHKYCGAKEAALNSAINAILQRNEELREKIAKEARDRALLNPVVVQLRLKKAELTRRLEEDRPALPRHHEPYKRIRPEEQEDVGEEEDVPLMRKENPPIDVDVFVVSGAGAFNGIQRAMQKDAFCSRLKFHIGPPGDMTASGKSRRALVVAYTTGHEALGQMSVRALGVLKKTNGYSYLRVMILRPASGAEYALPPDGDISFKVVEVESGESLGPVDREKMGSLSAVAIGFVVSK